VRVEVEQQLLRVMTVLRDRLPSETYNTVLVALAGMADHPVEHPHRGEPFEDEDGYAPPPELAPALGPGEPNVEAE
jgi:hypothetical protein